MLLCTLSIRNHEKAYFWTSQFERDSDEKIIGFSDQLQCQPMEASGRFMQVWALETWMEPHFAINMPVVLKALGKEVEPKYVEILVQYRDITRRRSRVEDIWGNLGLTWTDEMIPAFVSSGMTMSRQSPSSFTTPSTYVIRGCT
jgi:hypothetical protein